MRILIAIVLLVAGVSTAWLLLRHEGTDGAGTGPTASAPSTDPSRPALDLARGDVANSQRAAVDDGRVAPGVDGAASPADAAAAPAPKEPPLPDPTFVGGVSTDPMPSADDSAAARAYEQKYASYSQAERVQALGLLRTTIEPLQPDAGKGAEDEFQLLKSEIAWLQDHLDV